MRGLFFKIFIILWIAQSLIFVISTAFILSHRFPRPNFLLDPAYGNLRGDALEGVKRFDSNGCSGFSAYAQERHETLALADAGNGSAVCGEVPAGIAPQAAGANAVQVTQSGNDTLWSAAVVSASGKTLLFITRVPRHREEHPWYEDLYHFASPQLPVAIAVGGATTFVLVLIFTRPLARLRQAARQLAQGKLDTRVKEAPSQRGLFKGDEFDALVHDFNHMAERLESLVNAQKLLLRDVSHELRSPLARLSVALELAREDADDAMGSHLDRFQREAERLNQLIGQLLTLSSLEASETLGDSESFSLRDLLEEIAEDARYEAQQRSASVVLDAKSDYLVKGRKELIYRAIENVVRNAVRYTEPGTAVEIRLRKEGPEAVVEVSDHGPGIPEPELTSIFRPFYRVDMARSSQTGGFGVGLAIAERAVKLHNGVITAANGTAGGVTIQIRLPIAG